MEEKLGASVKDFGAPVRLAQAGTEVALGLWLFTRDGAPPAVLQRDANPQFGSNSASLEVLATDPASTAHFLPDGALTRVEDHTLGIGRRSGALGDHGQHLKRGLLLYGPPGTGKTHTVRYLLGQSGGTTAVLREGTHPALRAG